jgi:hypothetical protein
VQHTISYCSLRVKDSSGNFHGCRLLRDSGSQLSFVTRSFAKGLNLKLNKSCVPVKGIHNNMAADISHTCDVEVFSRFGEFCINVNCAVVEAITGNLPSQHI